MSKEELTGSFVGTLCTIGGMVTEIIDIKGIFNAILIAGIGAFVGAVVTYFTKMILNKFFKK